MLIDNLTILSATATVWWMCFFTAAGLCVGSFINVVIYRLPLGLRLSDPTWSFCPSCGNPIAWYDNLPVVGFLLLRGRCRNCWQPISPRYAFIELMTAITVVVLMDRFFIGSADTRASFTDLNWLIAEHWPIFLAHFVLFASLLAMSAIDIQYYWVDIRFTHFAAFFGLVMHAFWKPGTDYEWMQPHDGTAIAAVAAFVGFAIVWIVIQVTLRAPPAEDAPLEEPSTPATTAKPSTRIVLIPLAIFLFLCVTTMLSDWGYDPVPYVVRCLIALTFFFALIVYEAAQVRETDTEIVQAIEFEAPDALRMTLGELACLAPGIILGVAALWLAFNNSQAAEAMTSVLHNPMVWGISRAITGYVIAASVGWGVRIVANLLYGKEAFATGDIHMMAAAGCVAGWQIVVIGFVLCCFIAVVAWIALLPFKRTRAIPLGPWLWIGMLTATVFYDQIAQSTIFRNLDSAFGVFLHDVWRHPLFGGV